MGESVQAKAKNEKLTHRTPVNGASNRDRASVRDFLNRASLASVAPRSNSPPPPPQSPQLNVELSEKRRRFDWIRLPACQQLGSKLRVAVMRANFATHELLSRVWQQKKTWFLWTFPFHPDNWCPWPRFSFKRHLTIHSKQFRENSCSSNMTHQSQLPALSLSGVSAFDCTIKRTEWGLT